MVANATQTQSTNDIPDATQALLDHDRAKQRKMILVPLGRWNGTMAHLIQLTKIEVEREGTIDVEKASFSYSIGRSIPQLIIIGNSYEKIKEDIKNPQFQLIIQGWRRKKYTAPKVVNPVTTYRDNLKEIMSKAGIRSKINITHCNYNKWDKSSTTGNDKKFDPLSTSTTVKDRVNFHFNKEIKPKNIEIKREKVLNTKNKNAKEDLKNRIMLQYRNTEYSDILTEDKLSEIVDLYFNEGWEFETIQLYLMREKGKYYDRLSREFELSHELKHKPIKSNSSPHSINNSNRLEANNVRELNIQDSQNSIESNDYSENLFEEEIDDEFEALY